MGELIGSEWKGYKLIIHDHDCDIRVTMVECVDVLDNDWFYFRLWHAIHSSSSFLSLYSPAVVIGIQTKYMIKNKNYA